MPKQIKYKEPDSYFNKEMLAVLNKKSDSKKTVKRTGSKTKKK